LLTDFFMGQALVLVQKNHFLLHFWQRGQGGGKVRIF